MLRRGLLISGLGLSLTMAGAGVFTQGPALAQDASDTASSSQTTQTTREERRAEWEAERQAQYENFLAKFAENLGISDPAQVETAFKDTLKDLIDEQFEAGDISANAATDLKTRIDEADLQDLFGGMGGFGGNRMIGFDRHDHGDRGPRGMERRVKIWGDSPSNQNVDIDVAMPGDLPPVGGEVDSLPAVDEADGEPDSTPAS